MDDTRSRHVGKTLRRIFRIIPYVGVLRLLRGNLFDAEYYRASNPDVAATRINPFLHFLIFGAFEGRKPHPLFDPGYYLWKYPDVAEAEVNPLAHYLKHGAAEGRRPHPLFDPDWEQAGVNPLFRLARSARCPESVLYSWWQRLEARQTLPRLSASPRFSLLLEVSEARLEWLKETIASVQAQNYACWELFICDNAAGESGLREYLDFIERSDTHTRLIHFRDRLDLGLLLNQAAALAIGDYLVVIGQEDRLAPDALHWLATKAPADVIYSDEDQLDDRGDRVKPIFKPDWSPDLLFAGMYLGRIMAVSRIAWERCGGFRSGHGDMRDYDLALRVTEQRTAVQHVPRVLYHWRGNRDSRAGLQCLEQALRRRKLPAEIEEGSGPQAFRLRWKSSRTKPASVIVCSRTPHLLERCLTSLDERTAYPKREVIVVHHLGPEASAMQAVIARHAAKHVPYSGPFDFSRMNNLGAQAAEGEILVFLNDDTELLEPSWLDRLVAQVERADVGVAGARLLYPSGTLQHGGVAIGIGGGCGHIGRHTRTSPGHWPWLEATRDVSAVTGACLAIRAPLFHELGGFAEAFPVNYNDIDLCLRARNAGYRVIYEAGVTIRHYECQSRPGVVTLEERDRWHDRWSKLAESGDPFYNPNLTQEQEDLSLRDPSGETPGLTGTRRATGSTWNRRLPS
jgi:glycosyltransferase involved in cell wall biosynthesis